MQVRRVGVTAQKVDGRPQGDLHAEQGHTRWGRGVQGSLLSRMRIAANTWLLYSLTIEEDEVTRHTPSASLRSATDAFETDFHQSSLTVHTLHLFLQHGHLM